MRSQVLVRIGGAVFSRTAVRADRESTREFHIQELHTLQGERGDEGGQEVRSGGVGGGD